MDTNGILVGLRAERDRIDQAISAIEAVNSTGRRRGRPPGSTSAPKKHRRRRMRGRSQTDFPSREAALGCVAEEAGEGGVEGHAGNGGMPVISSGDTDRPTAGWKEALSRAQNTLYCCGCRYCRRTLFCGAVRL